MKLHSTGRIIDVADSLRRHVAGDIGPEPLYYLCGAVPGFPQAGVIGHNRRSRPATERAA
jgi:hypothetical protein